LRAVSARSDQNRPFRPARHASTKNEESPEITGKQ
jgi:hypothetical protein